MSLQETIDLMISDDYKERFLAEYFQLEERYQKLSQMCNDWDNGSISFEPTCPRSIYDLQLTAMKFYLDILTSRACIEDIDLFPSESNPSVTRPKRPITVTDVFEHYNGEHEYEGIIARIQTWYYGKVLKTPWCATSMCWAIAQIGLLQYTIQKSTENVYILKERLDKAVYEGKAWVVSDKNSLERGDIIIFNWSGRFSTTSSKHVSSFVRLLSDGSLVCIGGNQQNAIRECSYSWDKVVCAYRLDYSASGVKDLSHLPKE